MNLASSGPDGSTFTIGSTQVEVLAAQGNPSSIGGYNSSCSCYRWRFGSGYVLSYVGFDTSGTDGVVKNWDNSGSNLNLGS